jgi:hypothetical protein
MPDHPAGALELTAVTGQGWLDQIVPARLPETAPTVVPKSRSARRLHG